MMDFAARLRVPVTANLPAVLVCWKPFGSVDLLPDGSERPGSCAPRDSQGKATPKDYWRLADSSALQKVRRDHSSEDGRHSVGCGKNCRRSEIS